MWRLVLVLVLSVTAARAGDPADIAQEFRAAFGAWTEQVGATRGVISLRHDGQPVASFGLGMPADTPVALASLSKAVTATCIAALVDAKRLTYDTQARRILDLPRAAPVTIGALLSHATGLEKDHTQRPMAWWKDDPTARWSEVAPAALDRKRLSPGKPRYYYSNENYAVLGTVIETVTGQPYDEACRDLVLKPAGVVARPAPRFAAYLPWGGWQMTMADYAAFVDYAYGRGGVLTDRLTDLPSVVIEGPVSYGMGMVQRSVADGRNVWHFGALCFDDGTNLGAYAVHWTNGWTVTAWYDACATGTEMGALDQAMIRVAYGQG